MPHATASALFPILPLYCVWGKGSGQPHLPPAPFPARPATSLPPVGDVVHLLGIQGRDPGPTHDIEGKKLPFEETRGFPHSHKFPWRRQDLVPNTKQIQTPLSFPLGARDLTAPICSSSSPFSGSLQPLRPHVSFHLVSVLGQNAAYPTQHCMMESQTTHLPLSMDSSKNSYKSQDSWRNQRAVREGPQAHLVSGQHRPSTLSVWPGDLQGKTQVPQEEVTSSILVVVL